MLPKPLRSITSVAVPTAASFSIYYCFSLVVTTKENMSTVVMNNPVFECSELFKSASAAKLRETNQQHDDNQQQQASNDLRRSYNSLVNLIEQHRKLDRSVSEPTSRYKTELCRPFEESGSCKYGDKCQFAHGYNELRNLARHPKYKTELCRTFHKIGFCPYGPRCHFVHNFEEARIHNLKVSSQLSQSPSFQFQSLYPSEFTRQSQPPLLQHHTSASSNSNTPITGLAPLLQPFNINMSLFEHLASSQQVVAAVAAASASAASSRNLVRANSLNLAAAAAAAAATASADYTHHITLHRSNSLGIPQHQQQHHYQQQMLHTQSRPKPLDLSPTLSLGSAADSTSPSSSLSQSPTNSMASFFSDDPGLSSCSFSFNSTREELLDSSTRTPSPLASMSVSVSECPRLPVFNRISQTIADLEHLNV